MMIDFEARRVIEALRSGVSSRAVGQYFSSARPDLSQEIAKKLRNVCETKQSDGMVLTGGYGEGKTHLLNTVYNMAHSENMVVSFISLSKETPFNKLHLVYQKLLHHTYLPKRLQPGFMEQLADITPNHPISGDMQAYTAKHLETDKLFYVFRAFLHTDDPDEKHRLLADLEGYFVTNAEVKRIYRRIFNEKCAFNTNFLKTKHMDDYFSMLSHLFQLMGYNGWVLLFDETELIGRLGKKARLKAYRSLAPFLFPGKYSRLQATYSLFALTTSYRDEVIDGKHEFENLKEAGLEEADYAAIEQVLQALASAKKLPSLTQDEMNTVVERLFSFYTRAYAWIPNLDLSLITRYSDSRSILRTRIRAVVECLDQLYQYGQLGDIKINELGQATFEEDIPDLTYDEAE